MDSVCLKVGIHGLATPIAVSGSACLEARATPPSQMSANAVGRSSTAISFEKPAVPSRGRSSSPWGFPLRFPLRSLWPKGGKNGYDAALAVEDAVLEEDKEEKREETADSPDNQGGPRNNENRIFNVLSVRSLWQQQGEDQGDVRIGGAALEEGNGVPNENFEQNRESSSDGGEDCEVCTVNYCDDDEKISFDKDSFAKLLHRVSLAEARLYAQMSDLGNLAYSIPQIKAVNLLRDYGLRFVTSSLQKREQRIKADKEKASPENQQKEHNGSAEDQKLMDEPSVKAQGIEGNGDKHLSVKEEKGSPNRITAASAYQIAASAASYLHSRTKSILPFRSQSISNMNHNKPESTAGGTDGVNMINEEVASMMASTDSVTAVVAAKEEVKQAVADDLNSAHSSPCEWFICDDDQNATRFFVIQGSESMASWQANLLFEPVQFEGFDVLVHRGIYEAAKGIYEQMLPEVRSHLKSYGKRAIFRFTGHSLGGSLSLLINLMLLIRGEVPSSSLLPVITFGAPTIMCGGDGLLHKLGLPQSHVKAITMHRDIVPRAFSCNYPNHVAEFLKAVNGNFRTLPCLTNQKLLFAPMGEFLILQPDETFSPNHDLLPAGSGLYLLSCSAADASEAERQMQAAKAVFLNSPHPLEILSDRAAYGSGGSIQRDHDMGSYLKSVKIVIKEEEELIRRRNAKREQEHRDWWRLVASRGVNAGIMHTAEESWKRFSRLVASQRMHFIVVFLFPARLLILGTLSVISLR